MRVLIQMGDSYPDESPCAKRMRTFHDVFNSNGDEVIVLAPKNNNSVQVSSDTIYCPTVPLRKKTVIYRLLNSLVFGLTSYIKSIGIKDIDVVVTTAPPPLINLFGLAIAKAKKALLVYDVRDIWPDVAWEMGSFSPDSLYSRVFEFIRNRMLSKADLVITVSPGKVKKLSDYNPKAEVIEITNGIDEEFLKNEIDQGTVLKYQLDKGILCSYIGNLGLAQGLKQLLFIAEKAKEKYPDARFLLFGSGAEEELLKKYTAEHNLTNVEFPGRIPNKLMYTILKYSKMSFVSLVNSNLKDSVPTKMYEALAVGCPVLLAAEGDSADILNESKLGVAVKPNDSEELWRAYETMLNSSDYFNENKEYCCKYIVGKYSRQKAARKFEDILKDCLHGGRND